jgi:hypothetical protein
MVRSFVLTGQTIARPSITHANSGVRYDCELNKIGNIAAYPEFIDFECTWAQILSWHSP